MSSIVNIPALTYDDQTGGFFDKNGFFYSYDFNTDVYTRDDGAKFTMNSSGGLSLVGAVGFGASQKQILILAAIAFFVLKG